MESNRKMAPETGLEPVTRRLTAGCSTIELLWNPKWRRNLQTKLGTVNLNLGKMGTALANQGVVIERTYVRKQARRMRLSA